MIAVYPAIVRMKPKLAITSIIGLDNDLLVSHSFIDVFPYFKRTRRWIIYLL
jgi:hypothetical protein